jgi:DNA-binding NtrC family response regulator
MDAPVAETEHDAAHAPLRGHSILIVEDQALIALDLRDALQDAGARAICANAPVGALKLIDATLSAAIVDFQLGANDADVIVQALEDSGVPFLIYTGYPAHPLRRMGRTVINKPARIEDLIATLERLIRFRDIARPTTATTTANAPL